MSATPPPITPPAKTTEPVFDALEVNEVVAFELYKKATQNTDDVSASASWREDQSTRMRYRAEALAMFTSLGALGLKLSTGRKAAITARIKEIDTIPERKAYDLATDTAT